MSDRFMVADRPDMRKPPLRSPSLGRDSRSICKRQIRLFVLREEESVQFIVDRLRSISK